MQTAITLQWIPHCERYLHVARWRSVHVVKRAIDPSDRLWERGHGFGQRLNVPRSLKLTHYLLRVLEFGMRTLGKLTLNMYVFMHIPSYIEKRIV